MKITHICLCGPVTDGFNYQDNLLPKYHKKIGLEVSVITSKHIWNSKGELDIDPRSIYFNEFGIKTIRLENKYKTNMKSKFKKYNKLYEAINDEEPEIIFVHGCQFIDIKSVIKYAENHPDVKVYVDNHADFSNSAQNFISKNILHKIIWKYYAHLIEPLTIKFYGVLPARVEFLQKIYKLPLEKLELLVMGADDELVEKVRNPQIRKKIRSDFGIEKDDFLLVTGGKIDNSKKQILMLMEVVKKNPNSKVKLIVFGSVIPELEKEVKDLEDKIKVQYIGWIKSEESYNYFSAADLVVFPGRHSVFWEQVVGMGKPMIVKYWQGTTHVDLGGNVAFLYRDSYKELKELIEILFEDRSRLIKMEEIASSRGIKYFSYYNISRRSIINEFERE